MEDTINRGALLWGIGSAAQFGWAVQSLKKGFGGDSCFMPFRAFCVASLFIGASASASFALLHASGIHKLDDALDVGAKIRTSLGIRARDEDKTLKD